jgi:hypothetical protein
MALGVLRMIRSKWRINAKPIDGLAEFAGSFNALVGELAEESYRDVEDGMMDELRYYPAPPPNSTYIRTMRLKNGWKIHLDRTSDGVSIIVENNVGYAPFVVGSLAQALAAAKAFQARIHQGRWPLASETVSFWFTALKEDFDERFVRELGKFGTSTVTRRAFTR